tara:strand:+ start:677 stop:874 length:198 start_codon:yes stop_codon:yes gene_type:complete
MGNDIPFNENKGYVKQLGDDLSGGFGRSNTLAMDVDGSKLDFIKVNGPTITEVAATQDYDGMDFV